MFNFLKVISSHLTTDCKKNWKYQADWKYQTHSLSAITFIFKPDKLPKYRTVRLYIRTPGNPTW